MKLLANLPLFSEETTSKPYIVREYFIEHEGSRGYIDRLAYCYVKGEDSCTLHKHGEARLIEKYHEENKAKFKEIMVNVPKELTYMLNVCINISATNYPEELHQFIRSLITNG